MTEDIELVGAGMGTNCQQPRHTDAGDTTSVTLEGKKGSVKLDVTFTEDI